jgi:hypothetical protein
MTRSALILAALVTVACGRSPAAPSPVETIPPYDRAEWPHWIDADGDCQDTRQEVLIEESLAAVAYADARHCRVVAGLWRDAYTGVVYTDPAVLDVDHLVPLANAHATGGWQWPLEQRRGYANDLLDPRHLIAVHQSVNRQKGAQTPATWRPPDAAAWCSYGRAWTGVKTRWGLAADPAEKAALAELQATCSLPSLSSVFPRPYEHGTGRSRATRLPPLLYGHAHCCTPL